MKSRLQAFKAFMLAVFIFGVAFLPAAANASDSFNATVKVMGIRHYLNGQVGIVSVGSGTIINKEGDVLTNAHVVYDSKLNAPLDAFAICVSESPEEMPECRFTASLKRYDELIDLAILRIDSMPSWGSKPSNLPYISYKYTVDSEVGDKVSVQGYPSSGGGTISLTQGQISGFADINGFQYLKTDADIDAGNSGGAMFNDNGQFIGVPSYIVSYYENSGRVLHISEVEKWIDSGAGDKGSVNSSATKKLREEWKRFYQAEKTGELSYKTTPKLSVKAPDGWKFMSVSDSGFSLYKASNGAAVILVEISSNGYKLDISPAKKLDIFERIEEEEFPDHQFTKVQGSDALHFWKEVADGTVHVYSIDRGHKEITITYSIPKNAEINTLKEVNEFMDSIEFASPDVDDPSPSQVLNESNYPFSLEVPSEWRVVLDDLTEHNLARVLSNTHKLESVRMYYAMLAEGAPKIEPKDGLEYELENYIPEDAEMILESAKLKIDGLPGWLVIFEYELGSIPMKKASLNVIDEKYELFFDYKAEADIFDKGLKNFLTTLKSIKTKTNGGKGTFNIPMPNGIAEEGALSDIVGHRYKSSIENLVAMEVLGGYPDGSFKPENPVNRAEALKIILQSLRSAQADAGGESFVMPSEFNNFSDLKASEWYATYVAEGVDKGIINGYPDGTFKGGNTVNLAEALKMTLEAHGADVWDGDSAPWHKKYFDAAYALDLLPQDLSDPGKLLTRAELSYIVDQLVSQ